MRILYIDIDSCRPDHLGCYGYARPTSPVIDEIARRATRFENCHTSDAPCLPSRAALFSGRFGINNGVNAHEGPASQLRYAGRGHTSDPTRPMWMSAFRAAGYETVCFSSFGQRHLAFWFWMGFTQNFGQQMHGGLESADEVGDKVINWLKGNGSADNWFLHANFWDVHHPYRAPKKFFDRVASSPAPGALTDEMIAHDAQHIYGPRTARDWWCDGTPDWKNPAFNEASHPVYTRDMPRTGPVDRESYTGFVNGHDSGIARVDEKIGAILETLDALGIREETAIIVSADHAESIGELGMYFEHGNAAEGTTHVPLIIHWPGVTKRTHAVPGLCYQLDLAPTIPDLAGIPIPQNWDGRTLADCVRDETTKTGRDHLILGSGIYSYQRAVRTDRYRLIRTIHSGVFPYDPLYLFDMHADPLQRNNLADKHPDIVAQLDHLLLDWTYRHTTGPAAAQDPFQLQLEAQVPPDLYCSLEKMEQRLRDLNRLDQLEDLQKRRAPRPPRRL